MNWTFVFVIYNQFQEKGDTGELKNEINSLEEDFLDLLDLGDNSDIYDLDEELDDIQNQDFEEDVDDNSAFDELASELASELEGFLTDLDELEDLGEDDSLSGLDDDLDTINN